LSRLTAARYISLGPAGSLNGEYYVHVLRADAVPAVLTVVVLVAYVAIRAQRSNFVG
jgi:hypothetical protein